MNCRIRAQKKAFRAFALAVLLLAVLTPTAWLLHLPATTTSPVVRRQASAVMFASRTRSRINSSVSSNAPSVSVINEMILRKSEV